MSNILGSDVPEPVSAESLQEGEYFFASDNYPKFKTTLKDGTKIRFEGRVFKTRDAVIAKGLLDLMASSPAVNRCIRVIDINAQRKLAEQDQANRRDMAIKGAAHSAAMRLDARDEALDELRKDPQKAKDLEDRIVQDDMELTQSINRAAKEGNQPQPGASLEEGSGFVPLENETPVIDPLPETVEAPVREGAKPVAAPAGESDTPTDATVNSILGLAKKAAS